MVKGLIGFLIVCNVSIISLSKYFLQTKFYLLYATTSHPPNIDLYLDDMMDHWTQTWSTQDNLNNLCF